MTLSALKGKTSTNTKPPDPPATDKLENVNLPFAQHKQHTAYRDGKDHLSDELRWLNLRLAAIILQLRQVNFYEKPEDFYQFFISDQEIDSIFLNDIVGPQSPSPGENHDQIYRFQQQAQALRQQIDHRIATSAALPLSLPLVRLDNIFNLSGIEHQVMVICLAPQLEHAYERIYAYIQNDLTRKLPSVDLALSLICNTVEERRQCLDYFTPGAPLYNFNIIHLLPTEPATTLNASLLKLDYRMVSYILGHHTIDRQILSEISFQPPISWEQVVVGHGIRSALETLRQQEHHLTEKQVIYYLHGPEGVGKKTLIRAFCSEAGFALATADLKRLLADPEGFPEKISLILREGLLQPCAICLEHCEALDEYPQDRSRILTDLLRKIRELGWITFLCSETPLPAELLDLPHLYALEISRPGNNEQTQLWELQLKEASLDPHGIAVDQLVSRFDLTGKQIARAVRMTVNSHHLAGNGPPPIETRDFFASSRALSQPKLTALSRKIHPQFTWDQLVLPEDPLHQLQELSAQVKFRNRVMKDWGFERKLSLGKGISALFSGPSGTGKTMSAEIIANDLGLDLYKIDLSAVVSKYIGETEKNLNRVFTEAEYSNAILFFDEAEALLGKRSEVKDAHDRYANIEIAYLLQKMEEYEGITILATNLRQNIDEAFTRRIRFIIEFPFPDARYRQGIWEGIWPEDIPLAPDIDLAYLARKFEVTGGNIRNIALTAAFYAAEQQQPVTMMHLLQAARRELQKMGRLFDETDFGEHSHLLNRSRQEKKTGSINN